MVVVGQDVPQQADTRRIRDDGAFDADAGRALDGAVEHANHSIVRTNAAPGVEVALI